MYTYYHYVVDVMRKPKTVYHVHTLVTGRMFNV